MIYTPKQIAWKDKTYDVLDVNAGTIGILIGYLPDGEQIMKRVSKHNKDILPLPPAKDLHLEIGDTLWMRSPWDNHENISVEVVKYTYDIWGDYDLYVDVPDALVKTALWRDYRDVDGDKLMRASELYKIENCIYSLADDIEKKLKDIKYVR